jgi:hypothetical protein
MKKLYFLLLTSMSCVAFGQYSINFDDMSLGAVSPQSAFISLWPASGVTDCIVSDLQANSGTQSMQVRNNQTDDVLVLLGNKNSDSWVVSFYMYIPSNASGYWNIQESQTAGIQWNGEFLVGVTSVGGTAGLITYSETGSTIAFPYDQWFEVRHEINLNTKKITIKVNDSMFLNNVDYVGTDGVAANQLGSINFYSASANNNYFIDDFVFEQVSTASVISNNTAELKAYPNPVKDVLTVEGNNKITNVSVFNTLGVIVHSSTPSTISTQIDMSKFPKGIYLLEVTMGSDTKTFKVLK